MNLDKLLKNNGPPKKDDLTDQDLHKLFMKYKGLLKERERDKTFWEATNKNLENSYKKLDELVEKRTFELRAVNEQLQHEITERKQVEEELRKHRDHLEELIEKRTIELDVKATELEQANIQLKELDQLKSMFIASMSHELRTPLSSIIGFTDIILEGMSGEITKLQRKQLTMVKSSANHLLALINDIIDVSKIEAEKVELYIEEFDLSEIVQDVKDSFTVAADKKGLNMPLNIPKRLIITSDERRENRHKGREKRWNG